jgi:hypothetical protein
LEGLSDATLRDIGITRCDAHREGRVQAVRSPLGGSGASVPGRSAGAGGQEGRLLGAEP